MNYYTYGRVPPELWPVRNEAPLSQVQQEQDSRVFDEQQGQGLAMGGLPSMIPQMGRNPLAMMAQGGDMGADPHPQGGVAGPGTGRSDDIPAQLSDGEYVIDAETVSLLGDGSTAAGAKLLDQFRADIRAHKGKALAKGEFSPAARPPLEYLAGVTK